MVQYHRFYFFCGAGVSWAASAWKSPPPPAGAAGGGSIVVVGGGVTGGQYSTPPSLTELVHMDNLQHTTDFRRVYATLIEEFLG